jgi:O-antigen ligase
MPEYIRALIVVLSFAFIIFAFAGRPVRELVPVGEFNRRRNLWFALTILGFLAQSFWIYASIAGLILFHSVQRETNIAALYLFLLAVVPVSYVEIPGFGLVSFLFQISHHRLLALVILLPAFLALAGRKSTLRFGTMTADKLILAYLVLVVLLYLRETSVTDTLRKGLYQFTDVFLPYYVISRSLRNLDEFRSAILSLVVAAMILAIIGIFEAGRHWLLYSSMVDALDLGDAKTGYLRRSGILRAVASTGQPIALGFIMAVAIGLYLYLQKLITSTFHRRMGMLLLFGGLLAPLSRGPWVGMVFIIAVFVATGKHATRKLTILLLAGILALPLMAILPGGARIINLIPFIGETEKSNLDYRQKLFEQSMIVIKRNPWFGSVDFMSTREMESVRAGHGMIDIVNSYLAVALETGFIGAALFIGFFLIVCWGIYRGFRRLPGKDSEEHLLGRALLASIAGILLIIATVSSITLIPLVYWSIAGMGVAYINMVRHMQNKHVQQLEPNRA